MTRTTAFLRRLTIVASLLGVALVAPGAASAAPGTQTGDPEFYEFVPPEGGGRVNVVSGNFLLTEDDLVDADATYHVTYARSYNSLRAPTRSWVAAGRSPSVRTCA